MGDFLILIVSYPRSGQVWLARLIARALMGKVGTRLEQDHGRDIAAEEFGPMPLEVQRTHALPPQVIDDTGAAAEGARVPDRIVHVVRDPRDVLVSNWRYRFSGPEDNGIHGAFQRMIRDGNWKRYVTLWESLGDTAPAHATVRYEDLMANTDRTLRDLLVALDLPMEAQAGGIATAVEREAFAKRKAHLGRGWPAPGWTDGSDEVSNGQALRHMGRAIVGGWEGEIPTEMLAELEDHAAELMERFAWTRTTE